MTLGTSLTLIRGQESVYGAEVQPHAVLLAGSQIAGLLTKDEVKSQILTFRYHPNLKADRPNFCIEEDGADLEPNFINVKSILQKSRSSSLRCYRTGAG